MKFNWENFKKYCIAVHCNSKEELQDFLNKCEENNIEIEGDLHIFNEKDCYRVFTNGLMVYSIDYLENRNCEIVEWKLESKYDKEYTFTEVIQNIREMEEWECIQPMYTLKSIKKIMNRITFHYKGNVGKKSLTIDLNAKFKLVKRDKKVEFMEAIKAFNEGKIIKVKYNHPIDRETITETYDSEYTFHNDITPYKILNGEWYVEED
ncbi:TPA: hypothetical protein PTV74_003165 [Clostridium botulinum]|nr:hypothetical protein [Clostridium botulinum]HDK7206320.1 hypothetical protein [Clostridium botulinum]HDK7210056.1 hypothetical protein [Clostridium botulinum]HDK7265505.1 hypothetical protein [Clostridium botulinum]HDK7269353.1 hypothetical protein [Clostridium botulinum]